VECAAGELGRYTLDISIIVRHEHTFSKSVRNCTKDEGEPLGVGLQERASNHFELLWSKAMVVSVEEKSRRQDLGRCGSRR